ncbi:MAG: hypothetical protein IPL35_04220 [Sphingobacteriales bacterium]|nr:hypothetical protein [Sphingobacteriales bacterium]
MLKIGGYIFLPFAGLAMFKPSCMAAAQTLRQCVEFGFGRQICCLRRLTDALVMCRKPLGALGIGQPAADSNIPKRKNR